MQGIPVTNGFSRTSGVVPVTGSNELSAGDVSVVEDQFRFTGNGQAIVVLETPDPNPVSANRTLNDKQALELATRYARTKGMEAPAVYFRTRAAYPVTRKGESLVELMNQGASPATQVNGIVAHRREVFLRRSAAGI